MVLADAEANAASIGFEVIRPDVLGPQVPIEYGGSLIGTVTFLKDGRLAEVELLEANHWLPSGISWAQGEECRRLWEPYEELLPFSETSTAGEGFRIGTVSAAVRVESGTASIGFETVLDGVGLRLPFERRGSAIGTIAFLKDGRLAGVELLDAERLPSGISWLQGDEQ
ncbi:MAG: hypothetical protein LKI24_15905 [Acidipropionibacterium sp.]|nr:hypothetical protein [Acidipropionibacterium sp.]